MAEETFRQACALVEGEGLQYMPHHHNAYVMRVGYLLNRMSVSLPAAHLLFDGAFADYEPRQSVLASCYRRTEEHNTRALLRAPAAPRLSASAPAPAAPGAADARSSARARKSRGGAPSVATVQDIQSFLDEQAPLRCNTVTTQTELQLPDGSWRELTDADVGTWWAQMSVSTGKSVRRDRNPQSERESHEKLRDAEKNLRDTEKNLRDTEKNLRDTEKKLRDAEKFGRESLAKQPQKGHARAACGNARNDLGAARHTRRCKKAETGRHRGLKARFCSVKAIISLYNYGI